MLPEEHNLRVIFSYRIADLRDDVARGRVRGHEGLAAEPLLAVHEEPHAHRAVAAALHAGMAKAGASGDALSYLASLPSREAVAEVLCTPALADALVALVWEHAQTLQPAH